MLGFTFAVGHLVTALFDVLTPVVQVERSINKQEFAVIKGEGDEALPCCHFIMRQLRTTQELRVVRVTQFLHSTDKQHCPGGSR